MGHWIVANPNSNSKLTDTPQYSGIGGHLFAIMIEESIKLGFEGFIEGTAANKKLLEHYINKLGAKPLDGYRFYIDEESAKALLRKYNWDEE